MLPEMPEDREMEALNLQKKTALLISAHTLPPSAEHSLTYPRCIFTQPLTCNPKGQGSRVFSISLDQAPQCSRHQPLAPPLPCPACGPPKASP